MDTKPEVKTEREQTGSAPARRSYAAPRLSIHGTVAQLTEAVPAGAAGSLA